jgi:hypothetical protein
LDPIPFWPVLAWGFAAIPGRSRIGFGKTWLEPGGQCDTARAGRDWGDLIRGNDGLIGDVDEPAGTGSMPFICVVPGGGIVPAGDLAGLGGTPAVRFVTGSV